MKPMNVLERAGDVRVTIWLFIVLGACSLAGVVYLSVFDALWFNVLLYLLAVNLAACISTKIWRNLRLVFSKSHLEGPAQFRNFGNHAEFSTGSDAEAVAEKVAGRLKAKRFGVSRKDQYKALSFSAKKGLLNKLGSICLHLGVIVLFVGGLVSKKLGFAYHQDISIGGTVPVRERTFQIRVDDFRVLTNEKGEIRDFQSFLTVIQDGREIRKKMIEVNDPLVHEGIHFYQSSYQREPHRVDSVFLHVSFRANAVDTLLSVPFDEKVSLGASGFSLKTTDFFADFSMDIKTKKVENRSHEHRNPAVRVLLYDKNDSIVLDRWLFFRHAGMHRDRDNDFQLTGEGYTPLYYTGLQVRENPGVPLVFAGIIMVSLGILLVFYVPVKYLWVRIEKDDNTSKVYIAGRSDRFKGGFEREFKAFVADLTEAG
jgi:cytochrome c biogenesis protein